MKEVLRLDHGVLTHFPASAGRNKPALILCPGGGYEYCSIREGAPVARAFARDGVEAFVLEYDCTEVPLGVKPLHTLSASVAWVREHAAQLGIAADRIAVGGFSAGAHLAGLLAATWHDADWFPAGTDLQAHRPNAAVLCYPVVSAGAYAHRGSFVRLAGENAAEQRRFSLETLVSARMPRTFLWHTLTDADRSGREHAAARGGFAPREHQPRAAPVPARRARTRARGFGDSRPDERARARPAYKPLAGALRGMAEGGITMQIRHTRPEDLPAMQEIFADARAFMRENGNPDQWGDRFPTQEMLDKDLALHRSYVCEDNGKIAATFAFTTDGEPTYRVIRGGAWLDDAPYGVVHRIAAAKGTHGAASFCMNWCMEQCGNIRIDTHANNKPMQGLLNKLGYTYCGVIELENGRGERLAFQKRVEK